MDIKLAMNANRLVQDLRTKDGEERKLKEACQDFEAMFTGLMLKSMRSTVPEDSLFGTSNQKEIFQSMFDQEIAIDIAHSSNNFGIGDALYQKLVNKLNK